MNKHSEGLPVYPFAAVQGQEKIKNALLWNLVNPAIGGLLISGEKGTAKSTLVRGAAALSQKRRFVELPLNVTEDRLVGSIDFQSALLDGQRRLEPGLLMEADGNILYVDEVNLLSDHIVSDLLTAAASGENVVEREGISFRHPARFVLVGSMNPEEGKLRPQFLDRFGLYAEAKGEKDPDVRVDIMRCRLEYERDPLRFAESYEEDTEILRERVRRAEEFLPKVTVTEEALRLAADLAAGAFCAGHRGEWVMIQTARAIAALEGRTTLTRSDIETAAAYALPHRRRDAERPHQQQLREPEQDEPETPEDTPPEESPESSPPDEAPEQESGEQPPAGEPETPPGEQESSGDPDSLPPSPEGPEDSEEKSEEDRGSGPEDEDVQTPGEPFAIPRWQDPPAPRTVPRGSGRRSRVRSATRQGRYVGCRCAGEERPEDLAFDATVRAAAPFQSGRDKNGRAVAIEKEDLRLKIREKRTGGCILFVVDASASMGANKRMREVKAAILSMLNVSYQKRDQVGLIAFRKEEAQLLLGFTRSVELAQKQLESLPTGGRTPLARGLELAREVIMGLRLRDPDAVPTLVLVSDGRASSGDKSSDPFAEALRAAERIGKENIHTILLDTENDFIRLHLCEKLNEKLHGILITMEELRSEGIVEAVDLLKARR